MARVTKESIQKVKDNVKISDVFEWLGTTVTRRGSNTMAFCPFCDDANSRNPAMSLDDVKGLYHCFRCGASGDTISAVMDHEECSFPEAIDQIATQFEIPVEYMESDDPEAESRRKHYVSVLEAAQEEFLAQRSDPHYQKFLDERNIPAEVADKFGLGLSLMTEADGVVERLIAKFGSQALIDTGLCYHDDRKDKLVLRFRNRLMFPIRTAPGTLVAFGGRDLTGKSPAKYKNSPESEIFKKRNVLYGMDKAKRAMSKSKRAIVCEGYMDTIALQSHGFEYSVGAMGTALTQYNLNKLSNFADTIYLSLDADKAGVSAAMRTADTVPQGFSSQIRVLMIPEVEVHDKAELEKVAKNKAKDYLYIEDDMGHTVEREFPFMAPLAKDPDEFFNQVGHTTEEFEDVMRQSPDLFLFCAMMLSREHIEAIEEEMSNQYPDGAKLSRERQKAKKAIGDFVARTHSKTNIYQRQYIANYMIGALRLVETFEQLEEEWRRAASRNRKGSRAQEPQFSADQAVFSSSRTAEEDMLIATLYFHPETRNIIKANISNIQSVFTSAVRMSIFDKLNAAYGKGMDEKQAMDEMDEHETKELARIVMSEKEQHGEGTELSKATIAEICSKVERHSIENQIEQESASANPDLLKIISLKQKLAQMS